MKHALGALLILITTLYAAKPKEDFPDFMKMGKYAAARTARKQAEADFAEGRYRMLVFGMRTQNSPHDVRLAKEGVEVRAIAGCIVNDGILEGARVYNEVMRAKLKEKHGRDIFSDNDKSQKQPAK